MLWKVVLPYELGMELIQDGYKHWYFGWHNDYHMDLLSDDEDYEEYEEYEAHS